MYHRSLWLVHETSILLQFFPKFQDHPKIIHVNLPTTFACKQICRQNYLQHYLQKWFTQFSRIRYLQFTCKLKQQYYFLYVDFDIKKHSKTLIEVTIILLNAWLEWYKVSPSRKLENFSKIIMPFIYNRCSRWEFLACSSRLFILFSLLKLTFQTIKGRNVM